MARKRAEQPDEAESGLPAQAGESRVYELGFHLDPGLASEEVKKAYNEIRAMISKAGEVVAEGEPVKTALAYTISRQETGGRRDFDFAHFAWIAYAALVEHHEGVVAAAKADTRIIRFIDLATDKETARAAAERAALEEKAGEPQEAARGEEAAVSEDAALDAALESATR